MPTHFSSYLGCVVDLCVSYLCVCYMYGKCKCASACVHVDPTYRYAYPFIHYICVITFEVIQFLLRFLVP